MKLKITFKTPDAVDYAIRDTFIPAESDEDSVTIKDIENKLSKWVKYGEMITVEFDLEAMTAEVVPNTMR